MFTTEWTLLKVTKDQPCLSLLDKKKKSLSFKPEGDITYSFKIKMFEVLNQ